MNEDASVVVLRPAQADPREVVRLCQQLLAAVAALPSDGHRDTLSARGRAARTIAAEVRVALLGAGIESVVLRDLARSVEAREGWERSEWTSKGVRP